MSSAKVKPGQPVAYGYARVSSPGQFDHGVSLDHQASSTESLYRKRYASTHSWGGSYGEPKGVSAFKVPFHRRPAGKKLLALLKRGDVLIVDKPDRIFRSVSDFAITVDRFTASGLHLCIMDLSGEELDTTTPMGQFYLHALMIFAQLESALKSQRSRDAKTELRRKNRPLGQIPYGFTKGGHGRLVIDRAKIPEAKRIYRMCLTARSLYNVRHLLESEHCRLHGRTFMPNNKLYKWHYSNKYVRRLLCFAEHVLHLDLGKIPFPILSAKRYDSMMQKYAHLIDPFVREDRSPAQLTVEDLVPSEFLASRAVADCTDPEAGDPLDLAWLLPLDECTDEDS